MKYIRRKFWSNSIQLSRVLLHVVKQRMPFVIARSCNPNYIFSLLGNFHSRMFVLRFEICTYLLLSCHRIEFVRAGR